MRSGATAAAASISMLWAFGAEATADKPVTVPIEEVPFIFNGGFTPKKLPQRKLAPIALNVAGKAQLTGGIPPRLREVVIEADRRGAIDTKGLPICTAGRLEDKDTGQAREACPQAIVGRGMVELEVEYPENSPFIAKSKLLAFNRGVSGGKTTILIHAYFGSPMSISVIVRAKVSKIDKGSYGLRSTTKIPRLADGYGWVRSFSLTFDRGYKDTPYLFAKCPDGRLQGRATGVFTDGTLATSTFLRSCTPTG